MDNYTVHPKIIASDDDWFGDNENATVEVDICVNNLVAIRFKSNVSALKTELVEKWDWNNTYCNQTFEIYDTTSVLYIERKDNTITINYSFSENNAIVDQSATLLFTGEFNSLFNYILEKSA
jgi:hypothetical protein